VTDATTVIALADDAATRRAGARLASGLRGGDAIALVGELGAGKTTLVGGVVAALGGDGAHSPTFALVHEYKTQTVAVWHVDLYRVERESELAELGLDDVIGDPRGVAFVEWADKYAVMPRDHLRVELAYDRTGRTLCATSHGPASERLRALLDGAW